MNATEINTFSTVTELLAALRGGSISSSELLELHLRRIEQVNPSLNAIVTPDYARARSVATAIGEGSASGLALQGLPITIKDSIDVQGLRSTAGQTDRANTRAEADAPIVARVRAAGAVIMGKTNIPPLTADWQSNNPLFGCSNNPWDLTRTPGGSTGGGAAALAAGLTPLEFGSDLAGSIRIPAAFCGVYGHKPSETALPHSGHFPGSPLPNAALAMTVQGPLARSAEDLELAMGIVAGPDLGEDTAWRLHLPAPRHVRLSDYRVAILPAIPWFPLDNEVAAEIDSFASRLSRSGLTVSIAQPAAFGDMREYIDLYYAMMTIMTFRSSSAEIRERLVERMTERGDNLALARIRGVQASAADYLQMHARREQYRQSYRDFFRDWDVLIAPVALTPAFPHDHRPWSQRSIEVNGKPELYELLAAYPAVATLAGQPATAFPIGQTAGGLPIGLQAIGPYLEDLTAIRFTGLVGREFGGYRRPPELPLG